MAKTVPAESIVSVSEILALAGVTNRRVLIQWRNRDRHPFPKPIRTLACGELWDGRAVERWLTEYR